MTTQPTHGEDAPPTAKAGPVHKPPPEGVYLRTIKSYVLRAGRMGSGQVKVF